MKLSRQLSPNLLGGLLLGVAWWHFSDLLWLWLHDMPMAERRAFGGALLLYVIAKFGELHDHEIAAALASSNRNVQ